MLVAMISGFKASVQTELNGFFAHLANQADLTRKASAQAFSKARKQFSHIAFARLNQYFMRLVADHLPTPRWGGFNSEVQSSIIGDVSSHTNCLLGIFNTPFVFASYFDD